MSENLFEAAEVVAMKARLEHLQPDSRRQWGKMNAAQMLAHCTGGLELALGERRPPRMLIGRILGGMIKRFALTETRPMAKNSPTIEGLYISDERDFNTERDLLAHKIDRFASAGAGGCTTHPHSFFGRLTPAQWSTLMHKHLDHHLRQFGV